MRKVVATAFTSLDGVMQAPGGPEEDRSGGFAHGGWSVHYWDEMMGETMDRSMAVPFDLLLGRKTYDIFAGHWPYVEGDPVADKFNVVAKYVATSSPHTLTWTNSHAIGRDVAGGVARLKQEEGPELLIQGSSQLIQALLPAGLIDEFRLWIFPVVLGPGKRLFGDGTVATALELAGSALSTTGVLINTYRPAGAVKTGSFALETPTAAEVDRRQRLTGE